MRTLYLDVASSAGTLACVTEQETVAMDAIDHRIDDGELMERISTLLHSAGWTYQDLTHVCCVTGPGGFTSLRVGCAVASALSWSLKIPVAGVKLWEVYGAREGREKRIVESEKWKMENEGIWLHSTKKTHVFMKRADQAEPTLLSLEELRGIVESSKSDIRNSKRLWMGELIPEHRTLITELGYQEAPLLPLSQILPNFVSNLTFTHDYTVLPWYGRGW